MRIAILLLLCAFSLSAVAAEKKSFQEAMKSPLGSRILLAEESLSLDKIPQSVEEFVALRDKIALDPRGGFAMFVCAMIIYGKDKTLGLKCLTLSLDQSLLTKSSSSSSYKGFSPKSDTLYLIQQIDKFPWLGGIYVEGTTAENSYTLKEKGPYKINFNQLTKDKENEVRLYAFTTSDNLPRPITLKKNDKGIWKALNISSVVVGPSKLPAKTAEKDDL